MTEPEIRRALAICNIAEGPLRSLLAALEWIATARELMWEATENPNVADWSERFRAFLAEGESK